MVHARERRPRGGRHRRRRQAGCAAGGDPHGHAGRARHLHAPDHRAHAQLQARPWRSSWAPPARAPPRPASSSRSPPTWPPWRRAPTWAPRIPSSAVGKMDETMEKKVASDAAAYIRSIAARRGRNVEMAEKAVLESRSFTEREALDLKLVDLVVKDVDELLARARRPQREALRRPDRHAGAQGTARGARGHELAAGRAGHDRAAGSDVPAAAGRAGRHRRRAEPSRACCCPASWASSA